MKLCGPRPGKARFAFREVDAMAPRREPGWTPIRVVDLQVGSACMHDFGRNGEEDEN